jgi:hypothetical protein
VVISESRRMEAGGDESGDFMGGLGFRLRDSSDGLAAIFEL